MRRKIMPEEATKEEINDIPKVEETKKEVSVSEVVSLEEPEKETKHEEKVKEVPVSNTESSSGRNFRRQERTFQNNEKNRNNQHGRDSRWDNNDTYKNEKKEEIPKKKKKDKKKKKKEKSFLGKFTDIEFSVTYTIAGLDKELTISVFAEDEDEAVKKVISRNEDEIEIISVEEACNDSDNNDDDGYVSIGLDNVEGDDEDAGLWESAFKD